MEASGSFPASSAPHAILSESETWPRRIHSYCHWFGRLGCSTGVTRRSVLGLALLGLTVWAAYTERLLKDFGSGTTATAERSATLPGNPRRAGRGRSLLWEAAIENQTANTTGDDMFNVDLVPTIKGDALKSVSFSDGDATTITQRAGDANGSSNMLEASGLAIPITPDITNSIGRADTSAKSYSYDFSRQQSSTREPLAQVQTTFRPGKPLTGSLTNFEQAQTDLPGSEKHPWTTMMSQATRAERKWTLGYKFFIFACVAAIAFSGFLLARKRYYWKTSSSPRHSVSGQTQWQPLPIAEQDETVSSNTWANAVGSEDSGIQLAEIPPEPRERNLRLPLRRLSPGPSESEPECELDPAAHMPTTATGSTAQPSIEIKVVPSELSSSPASRAASDVDPDPPQRIVFMYASPLCYINASGRPIPMVQIPFEREWDLLVHAYDEAVAALRTSKACRQCPAASMQAQPLTAASLQRVLTPSPNPPGTMATVLHLSAHGAQGHLVLDNGRGKAHFFDCATVGSMLDMHNGDQTNSAPARLVILNSCSLQSLGMQFVNGGVPHVICSRADLRDSASQVFLGTVYSNLFQGRSVAQAFEAALVSLRSDPERATQTSAEGFCLLPENAAHSEVLFCPEHPQAAHVQQAVQQQRIQAVGLAPAISETQGDDRCQSSTSNSTATALRAFLVRDGAASSSDGLEDSHSSEGHVETSSTSQDEPSSDSDGVLMKRAEPMSSDVIVPQSVDLAIDNRSNAYQVVADSPTAYTQRSRLQMSLVSEKRNLSRVAGCAMRARRRLSQPTDLCVSMYKNTNARTASNLAVPQSPFGCAMPMLPEDFLGRSVDIWSVLQHISNRRAVVVCGGQDTEHGIGKSSLLSAVHRAFALQMCGICVTVQLNSLSCEHGVDDASSCEWVDKVKASVLRALKEQKSLLCKQASAVTRPRPASTWHGIGNVLGSQMFKARVMMRNARRASRWSGRRQADDAFDSLNEIAARRKEEVVDELVAAMGALAELSEMRCREWPPACPHILLLLDECDHLIQQPHFQRAIAEILQRCGMYRLVLSTQQPMVDTVGCWFKVVHHTVEGLEPRDAARLFLRRAHRPVTWGELVDRDSDGVLALLATQHPNNIVNITKENENDVLDLVAAHPAVHAQQGNPRRIVELASKVHPSLKSISDLVSH